MLGTHPIYISVVFHSVKILLEISAQHMQYSTGNGRNLKYHKYVNRR